MEAVVASYLIGSIPTGYLVTRALTGKDIREEGSRNVGGLNTYRVVSKYRGKLAGALSGILVALVDASKAVAAYLISPPQLAPLSVLAAITGHNYPVWLGFRGGRGVAPLLGLFIYLTPLLALIFLLLQGVVYLSTKRLAPGAILSLLVSVPLYHILTGGPVVIQAAAELPVWMRYREKYVLWRRGELGVNM